MSRSSLHFDQSLPPLYGVAERLSPRIERLLASNPSPFTFRGTGVYLVGNGKEVAVIDPGPDQPQHFKALMAAIGPRKVSHILVTHTHRDHSPAAAALKKETGAKTYGYGPHATHDSQVEEGGDRDFIPDVEIRDGDTIGSDGATFECVFTPGHTSNHMCYALKEEAALFTGDHVMGWSTTVIAPPDGDMGAYLNSLQKLIAREDRIFYPTHGSPITKPRGFVRAMLAHRRMREKQIARALKQGRDTPVSLVEALYPELAPSLRHAAQLTVEAHLKHMLEQGVVKLADADRYELSAAR
jgi:glyoxylase-like metal-dependent hydrolase (beta-lactamase superfamily II)